jgi:hypothetical protein
MSAWRNACRCLFRLFPTAIYQDYQVRDRAGALAAPPGQWPHQ